VSAAANASAKERRDQLILQDNEAIVVRPIGCRYLWIAYLIFQISDIVTLFSRCDSVLNATLSQYNLY